VINGIEVAESTTGLPALPVPPPPSVSTATRFDFGTSSSPLAGDFTQVGATNVFNPDLGYGWTSAAPTFSRGGPNALLQDGHWGTDNTFLVNVNPGSYIVNVTVGDASFARNNIRVDVNEVEQISNLTTAAGRFAHASTGPVSPNANGQLAIRVRSTGGDPYFTINALEVFPVTATPQVPGSHTLTPNDGGTTINGSGATAGALITVTTTLGTITGTDQSTPYAGHQVVADGSGDFSFTVTPPGGGGSATFTTEEVTGKGKSAALTYDVRRARRSPVRLQRVGERYPVWLHRRPRQHVVQREQRLRLDVDGVRVPAGNDGLLDQSCQCAAVPRRTLGICGADVPGGGGSRRNVQRPGVCGRSQFCPEPDSGDNGRCSGDGRRQPNSPRMIPSTAANGFVAVTVVGGKATDGILDITIINTGGDPYWVINGIDVWQSGANDPGALNLLPATWSSEMVGHR
jgi:hypothetical protein